MTTSASITPDPGSVVGILADVARRGITLQADPGSDRGKIRFRPRSAMTPDLAYRIKAHRSALLALLSGPGVPGADTTPPADNTTGPDDGESGVSSVVSVSERGDALWSEDELAMLARAGTTPADLPLVSVVKDTFADFGATVVSIESAHGRGGWTRRRAADLIRASRRKGHHDQAIALRDAWRERIAVCMIDGGMTQEAAERVAASDLEGLCPNSHVPGENYFGSRYEDICSHVK